MKKTFYILSLISLFVACKTNIRKAGKSDSSATVKIKPAQNAIATQFEPFFKGVWVRSDYIGSIRKTGSPFASRKWLGGVAGFSIESLTGTDSIPVGYSMNNHEGSDFVLYFKSGQNRTSLKVNLIDYRDKSNFYELGYNIKNHDTVLVLYHYAGNNHLIDSTIYSRVTNKAADETDAAWGIQFITNRTLISGRYIATDSTGNKTDIELTDNGTVSGLKEFSNYEVITDFEAGPENNVDQLGLYQTDISKAKWFAYKPGIDTLNLYGLVKNKDATLLSQGKLKYSLIKQK